MPEPVDETGTRLRHLGVCREQLLNEAGAQVQQMRDLLECARPTVLEVRELLTGYSYPGDHVPVMPVSATRALRAEERWLARLRDLMNAVDCYIPVPPRALDP